MSRWVFTFVLLVAICRVAGVSAQPGVLSNGRMLVDVGEDASLRQIQWPHVGAYNQLKPGDGVRWGISTGGSMLWSDAPGWRVSDSTWSLEYFEYSADLVHDLSGVSASVGYALDESGNRLLIGVEVSGMDGTQVVWESGYGLNASSPAEGILRAEPILVAAGASDVGDAIMVARPHVLSGDVRRRLGVDSLRKAEDWRGMGNGVWLAVWAMQRVITHGVLMGDDATLKKFGYGDMRSQIVVDGVRADEVLRAELILTFGRNYPEVSNGMDAEFEVAKRSPGLASRRFARQYGHIQELVAALRSRLVAHRSAETGAIVQGVPGDEPATPINVSAAAQALYALSFSGDADLSAGLANFLVDQINAETDSVRPLGSAYSAVLVTGEPWQPHWEVDLLPAAAIIWALVEYSNQIDVSGRAGLLRDVKPQLEMAADFLELWSRPLLARAALIDGLEPQVRQEYLQNIGAAQLGLDAAARLFLALDLEHPESWRLSASRARRALGARGIHVYAPWGVESIPAGPHTRLSEVSNSDALEARLSGLDTNGDRLLTLLSVGYQSRSGVEGVRIGLESLSEATESVLNSGEFEPEWSGTRELVQLLAILYQGYQSVP